MKKSLLALAVLSASAGAASAQTNVSIYGVADAGISYKDSGAATAAKTWGVDSGGQSGSRIGFKGSEDLGGGLSAIFTLENGYNIDDGTQGQGRLFGRQSWVGLNGGFGALKLGRQYNPIRGALETVDPFGLGLAGSIQNVFNSHGERADNTINYATPNLSGFSAQIAYSLGEVPGNNSAGRQLGVSAGYANGPVNLLVANHNRKLLSGTTPDGDSKTTMLGATYDFGFVKAHAAYAINKDTDAAGATSRDDSDMMLGISAPVGGAGAILASYIARDDKLNADSNATQLALGYTYSLSKRTNLYTSYAQVKNEAQGEVGKAAAGNDPSTFNVGIRHRF